MSKVYRHRFEALLIAFLALGLSKAGVASPAAQNGQGPTLQLRTRSIDFGTLPVGGVSQIRSVMLRNAGDKPLSITHVSTKEPFQFVGFAFPIRVEAGLQVPYSTGHLQMTYCPLPIELPPGASAALSVRFSPSSPGSEVAKLNIVSNSANSPTTVELSGTGIASGPAAMVPLTDMGETQTYLGFSGGLYEHGKNVPPSDQDAAAQQHAEMIKPLNTEGQPDPHGKIVLLSIGMSNTSDYWCGISGVRGAACSTPTNQAFMAQAADDPRVNHQTLAIVNGALGGQAANTNWQRPNDRNYDRVKNDLSAAGFSEKQVEAAWIMQADISPTVSLPAKSADAYALETYLGNIVRTLKVRYPNLQFAFLSGREYAGYASSNLNPEPYSYESSFSVKWLIQAQIDQMRRGGKVADPRAGDLNYQTVAPVLLWGPYLWANGFVPRSDGITWLPSDFNGKDFTHPGSSGMQKGAAMLLDFFLHSPYTKWFRSGTE
jgi:hypothetical protein